MKQTNQHSHDPGSFAQRAGDTRHQDSWSVFSKKKEREKNKKAPKSLLVGRGVGNNFPLVAT